MYARCLFSWPAEPVYRPLSNDVSEIEPEFQNALTRIVDLKAERTRDTVRFMWENGPVEFSDADGGLFFRLLAEAGYS